MIVGCLIWLYISYKKVTTWERTTAVVVESNYGQHRSIDNFMVIEFTSLNNQKISAVIHDYNGLNIKLEGENIDILFDPNKPQKVKYNSWVFLWAFPLLFFLCSFWILYKLRNKSKWGMIKENIESQIENEKHIDSRKEY